jgi:uncharacterized protein (DUF2141 family)
MKRTGILTLGFLLAALSSQAIAQSVQIRIINLKDSAGIINLAIYRDDRSFDEDKPFMAKKFSKQLVKNGELSVSISLEKGVYGIALLDDKNDDGRMEYNILGIPREGFGFSDFYPRGLKRPDFSDFDFELKDSIRHILIRVKYM